MKSNFGIRGIALNLFASYLSNRQQYTKIRNENSNLHKITCGVPQGSSLGPILFLLYINKMLLVTKFDITYLLMIRGVLFHCVLRTRDSILSFACASFLSIVTS